MICANACAESHVAYHSLEGRPQIIGSFITLPRANCVASLQLYRVLDAYSFTSLTQLLASMTLTYASMTLTYVLDVNVNVRLRHITCVNDAEVAPMRCVNRV